MKKISCVLVSGRPASPTVTVFVTVDATGNAEAKNKDVVRRRR